MYLFKTEDTLDCKEYPDRGSDNLSGCEFQSNRSQHVAHGAVGTQDAVDEINQPIKNGDGQG